MPLSPLHGWARCLVSGEAHIVCVVIFMLTDTSGIVSNLDYGKCSSC